MIDRLTLRPAAVPRLVPAVAAGLALLYVLAFDQGFLLSLAQGNVAFGQNLIHELVHDARHIGALPCH